MRFDLSELHKVAIKIKEAIFWCFRIQMVIFVLILFKKFRFLNVIFGEDRCSDKAIDKLQWRIWGGGAPGVPIPSDQNFFNFMRFFRNCVNILGRRPPKGWRPSYDMSWIRL